MTKQAEYHKAVTKHTKAGMSATAAFAQVADDMEATAATVQTGYYREQRLLNPNGSVKRNGKARAARTQARKAGKVVMPRTAPAHRTATPASELDILTANLSSAVDALREYTAREAGKVQRLREVLA